jgi:hypothetical protein
MNATQQLMTVDILVDIQWSAGRHPVAMIARMLVGNT